ncbi:MAG: hypothetical protein MK188_01545 [Gammaproteobacteria bacterium]|nr:hypothetical protein [Gammaproteobacteria bacterium]
MIRVILALIGLALIFIWLSGALSRKSKMSVTVISLVAVIGLVVIEVYTNTPREGIVDVEQLVICEQQIEHSYRSDFKVSLCLENRSDSIIKRVAYSVTAQTCGDSGSCEPIQVASRDRLVNLDVAETTDIEDTLRFENVAPEAENIIWSTEIVAIKAVPN